MWSRRSFLSVIFLLFVFFSPSSVSADDILDSVLPDEVSAEESDLPDPRVEAPSKSTRGTPVSKPPVNSEGLKESKEETVPQKGEKNQIDDPSEKKGALSAVFYALQDPKQFLPAGKSLVTSGNLPLLLGLLTIVPAVLITTTCYVRVMTVLALLRHALGIPQIPSTQILAAVSLFLTILVMSPTWTRVWREAWIPYVQQEISAEEAFRRGETPIRTFLWKQIERTRNTDNVRLFMSYIPDAPEPKYYEDVPWRALLPAYMLSELKTAFMIGFQLFLPFIIIDLVVSGLMVSMGMMMLPPAVVSLPFKLMLFVLLDAWDPIVRMLLESFTLT